MSVYNGKKWRTFRKFVAISGAIQGFTWLVMAAICIGLYYSERPHRIETFSSNVIDKETSYIDLISFSFYDTLLYTHNNYEDRLVKPENFHVFSWLYAVVSICWLGFATFECLVLFRKRTSKYDIHVVILFGIITIAVCILDLILMSLVSTDYSKINVFEYGDVLNWYESSTIAPTTVPSNFASFIIGEGPITTTTIDPNIETFESSIDLIFKYKIGRKLSYGILLTICTRGFIIWIWNFASGVILLRISLQMFRAPPILKYNNRSIPRAKIDQVDKDSNSFFEKHFSEDSNHFSTPPSQKKRYSVPPSGPGNPYGRDLSRNNPLALSDKHRRNENMFS